MKVIASDNRRTEHTRVVSVAPPDPRYLDGSQPLVVIEVYDRDEHETIEAKTHDPDFVRALPLGNRKTPPTFYMVTRRAGWSRGEWESIKLAGDLAWQEYAARFGGERPTRASTLGGVDVGHVAASANVDAGAGVVSLEAGHVHVWLRSSLKGGGVGGVAMGFEPSRARALAALLLRAATLAELELEPPPAKS